jgi:hypothetical protein
MSWYKKRDASCRSAYRMEQWIHMFLGLLDADPLVRGMDPDLDPSTIKQKLLEKP